MKGGDENLKILVRNPELMYWRVNNHGYDYSATIKGVRLELTRDDGTLESYGGLTLLARHVLEKENRRKDIREDFGDEISAEIFDVVKKVYNAYKQKKRVCK